MDDKKVLEAVNLLKHHCLFSKCDKNCVLYDEDSISDEHCRLGTILYRGNDEWKAEMPRDWTVPGITLGEEMAKLKGYVVIGSVKRESDVYWPSVDGNNWAWQGMAYLFFKDKRVSKHNKEAIICSVSKVKGFIKVLVDWGDVEI